MANQVSPHSTKSIWSKGCVHPSLRYHTKGHAKEDHRTSHRPTNYRGTKCCLDTQVQTSRLMGNITLELTIKLLKDH